MHKLVRTYLAYQTFLTHVVISNIIHRQLVKRLINTWDLEYFLRGAGGT